VGGIVGLEMATIYSALGSAVTVVELAGQIVPGADRKRRHCPRVSLEKRELRRLTAYGELQP